MKSSIFTTACLLGAAVAMPSNHGNAPRGEAFSFDTPSLLKDSCLNKDLSWLKDNINLLKDGGWFKDSSWLKDNSNWLKENSNWLKDGSWLRDNSNWLKDNSNWLKDGSWLKDNGGWLKENSNWLKDGSWLKDNSNWLKENSNWLKDGSWLKDNGGWLKENSNWLKDSGWLITGKNSSWLKSLHDETEKMKQSISLNEGPSVLGSLFELIRSLLGTTTQNCDCTLKEGSMKSIGIVPILKSVVLGILDTLGFRVDGVGSGGCDCSANGSSGNNGSGSTSSGSTSGSTSSGSTSSGSTSSGSTSSGSTSSGSTSGSGSGTSSQQVNVYYVYTYKSDASQNYTYDIGLDGGKSCQVKSQGPLSDEALQKYANECARK